MSRPFAFLQTVKLPGLYGGREAFANTHSKAEGNFQTYVMIREGGTVEFHIHSPLSTRPKRPTCTKPRGTNCNEDDVKFFVGGSSGRVGRGAWTAIRQDVWFASTQNAIGGYNLWINDTFVSGQSNIENLHLLPMENDEFSQTKHVFDDSGTGSSMYQMVGYPASKADGGKLVPYPSDERELDFGGPTKETQADGLSRGTLMTNENSGQPQLAVSGNSSPVGQEPKAPNYSQKVVQQNVTGVNMNNSRNLTTGNVNETKNATNTTSDYRYFGAFPALGIPELAELVKKNSHKVVPALTPQSIDSDKDEDEDEDEDGDEDEEADNNPSGEDLGPSSPSIQGANPNPLLGALGSLFLQHDESLQSNQLRHQPLRFFGFFTAPLSSHMTLPIRESNLEEPGLLLPSVKTFSFSLKPVDYAS
ncbi:hypothetical protein VP01_125g11 [Puccinia sorghi]|uniref:Polysaccharide lyase 14 domain-containing protein n=1 Tax=Puccinia sorghi TaxID=27349 RepID=A0A0L6VP87_9BASI|nr:hypothetical protein VP01_125g11 [Puccinia sorghi]